MMRTENIEQEGHSLEASSYLNLTSKYLGTWDPWTFGPLDRGPLDSWTSSLLLYFLLPPPISSSYCLFLLLSLPPTLLLWYGLVWGGIQLSFDIGD